MQKRFENYTNELKQIIEILNNFPPIVNISSKELAKYKSLISRKEFIQKKLNTLINKRDKIISKYNDKNGIWLSSKMNCRKYYKLEQIAAYSRDKSLYKLGFLDSKPVPPIIQNLRDYIQEHFDKSISRKNQRKPSKLASNMKNISKKSPICRTISKGKKIVETDVPILLGNIAISSVKKCILSYRTLSDSFSRKVSSLNSVKTIKFIIDQARIQADFQQNTFVSRIQVNPITHEYVYPQITQTHTCPHVSQSNYYPNEKITVNTCQSNLFR